MEQKAAKRRGGNVKMQAPKGFYTAKQAIARLGMNRSTFFLYVRQGKIKKYVPDLRTEGFYNKKEINELAIEQAMVFQTYEEEHTITRVVQPEDAQGIHDVLADGFGWQTAKVWQRLSWYEVNPSIDYVVIAQGKIMGYITAVPYTSDALDAIMHGRKRAWDMTPEDILPYEQGKEYALYVGAAVRQKDVPNRRMLAYRLIAGFLTFLEELAAQGILIKSMHAVSDEPDGQKLCRDLGFVEQPHEQGDLFPRFILDLETSDSRFARQYREAIQQLH